MCQQTQTPTFSLREHPEHKAVYNRLGAAEERNGPGTKLPGFVPYTSYNTKMYNMQTRGYFPTGQLASASSQIPQVVRVPVGQLTGHTDVQTRIITQFSAQKAFQA